MTSVHERYSELRDDQREFFDALISEEWESYINEGWDFSRRYEVARLFKNIRPARVLDIGCGCGFHDMVMAEYDFVEAVHGVDYSPKSIEKANEVYPHAKVTRAVADLRSDTVEPQFDLTVSFQVFEHLRDPSDYFRYSLEATRPGGYLALVTPNGNRLDNVIARFKGQPATMIDPQHFKEFSRRELQELAGGYGLKLIDHFGYGLFSARMPKLTPANSEDAIRRGAWVPQVANMIGCVFKLPD